ncbi:HAMP domain-containing histidine kinase [Ensifer sp. ENS10]|uniref:sensor histidine kinase n=2 Tax=unclassified Ensifer TaxID=2633371 RepID=UPI000DDA0519|nr:HAMP domain-containing sensor histidine kinase [Ensifer sp. ENS10]MBD9510798.1 HAMP domain-containing histidine kinase [Ensifer sp. ENS10]
MRKLWPRSLKQRLIAQLLVLQLAILLAFGLSFVSLLVLADEGGVLVSPAPVEKAFDAIRRGPEGKLVLAKTEEMGRVHARHPDFWFIARNDHGEIVRVGNIPAIYRGMSENLGRMTYSDIRDAGEPSPYLAVLRRRSNAKGDFTVFGQGELMSQSALILQFSRFSLAPMLVLLALVTVAGVPWIVNRASRDISPLAIDEGYEFSYEPAVQRSLVQAGSPSLRRTIINLAKNAIEHAGNRGAIVVRVERNGVIEICDDGPGVPEAERERIFEPFYRLKPRHRGAGHGLNLVLQITRRHGAQMTVLNSPGGGACFRMDFGSEAAE